MNYCSDVTIGNELEALKQHMTDMMDKTIERMDQRIDDLQFKWQGTQLVLHNYKITSFPETFWKKCRPKASKTVRVASGKHRNILMSIVSLFLLNYGSKKNIKISKEIIFTLV